MICKSISAYVALTAGVMASVNAAAIAPRDDRNPSHLLMWDHADTPAVPYNKMHQCTADTIGLRERLRVLNPFITQLLLFTDKV